MLEASEPRVEKDEDCNHLGTRKFSWFVTEPLTISDLMLLQLF